MKTMILCLLVIVVTNAQEVPKPDSFFPTSVGNVWEYSSQSYTYKSVIIRDSIGLNDSHFLFYASNLGRNRAKYKIDTLLNVFMIHTIIDTILYHYYKLDADSGETWKVRRDPPGTLARVDKIYKTNLWGKDRYVKQIGFYRPPYPFEDTTVTEKAVYERYVLLVSGIGEYYEFDYESGPERILLGCKIDGIIYGVVGVQEQTTLIPTEFVLHQNYPNPFNPVTTIEYALTKNVKVTLRIYNILGEEVKRLLEEYKQAGKHKITFDARGLPSGVYFYTLTAGGKTLSQKMVYAK